MGTCTSDESEDASEEDGGWLMPNHYPSGNGQNIWANDEMFVSSRSLHSMV
jgi:hypothetical protein